MTHKTWFITGASSGFGRQLTEQLLARGEQVAATARQPRALADLQARYGAQLWLATLDVTDTQAVRGVVAAAFAELGRIDVVVNNAGYGLFGAAEELSDAQIKRQIDTNLIGSIQVARAVLPHLRAQGGGRILQLSSMGGQVAFPALGLYHATKWGIEGFMESLMQEVAAFNIQITLVEPGSAPTHFAGASLDAAEAMSAYEHTAVGAMRRAAEAGHFPTPGDPAKIVSAMIDSVSLAQAPRRLTLGSDAYAAVHGALTERLLALERQRPAALATDFTPP